jgi:hypothetical protein
LIGLENWRLERLAYLRTTGRDSGISLKEALVLSTDDFGRMYPRFNAWLEAKGKPRGPSRAKAGAGGGGRSQGGLKRGFKKLKLGPEAAGDEGGSTGRRRRKKRVEGGLKEEEDGWQRGIGQGGPSEGFSEGGGLGSRSGRQRAVVRVS